MKRFKEKLPNKYCDCFDMFGEIAIEYCHIFNVDVYIKREVK